MSGAEFTHVGAIVGANATVPDGYALRVRLRATKLYWITTKGQKFRVRDGYPSPRQDWPMFRLELDSIKPITKV